MRPNRRQLEITGEASRSRSRDRRGNENEGSGSGKKKGRLSAWKMMALTVSMGGSQVSL
jgi:solute carrier family 45 protein 1/2/4